MRHDYVRTEQVTFAIAHDGELMKYETMQREIQTNTPLLEYYSNFVRTFQTYFTAFMARNSGMVAASEFSVPGLEFVPLPPVVNEAVHALEKIVAGVMTVREDNAIIRALSSIPDPYGFLTRSIQKAACEICMQNKAAIETLRATEHHGIFKLKVYYEQLKSVFFEREGETPQAELGISDALKLLSAFKKGLISIEVIIDDSEIVSSMLKLVKHGAAHEKIIARPAMPRISEDDEEGSDGILTHTNSSASTDPYIAAEHGRVIPLPRTLPTSAPIVPQAQHHWYDCFRLCYCSSSVNAEMPGTTRYAHQSVQTIGAIDEDTGSL